MGTQQGGWFECGNYTTDLPDEIARTGTGASETTTRWRSSAAGC